MIFLFAMLSAATGSDQPISAVIHAPHSIMPAVESYVACLNRAEMVRSQAAGPLHAKAMRGVVDQARADCATVRLSARANALKMIVSDPSVAEGERENIVDAALRSVDESDEVFLRELERREEAGPLK